MSEVETNVAECQELIMPHLAYTPEELDTNFPSLSVPVDVEENQEHLWDSWDQVYQRGLEIVQEIRDAIEKQGRKRCEKE